MIPMTPNKDLMKVYRQQHSEKFRSHEEDIEFFKKFSSQNLEVTLDKKKKGLVSLEKKIDETDDERIRRELIEEERERTKEREKELERKAEAEKEEKFRLVKTRLLSLGDITNFSRELGSIYFLYREVKVTISISDYYSYPEDIEKKLIIQLRRIDVEVDEFEMKVIEIDKFNKLGFFGRLGRQRKSYPKHPKDSYHERIYTCTNRKTSF